MGAGRRSATCVRSKSWEEEALGAITRCRPAEDYNMGIKGNGINQSRAWPCSFFLPRTAYFAQSRSETMPTAGLPNGLRRQSPRRIMAQNDQAAGPTAWRDFQA